MNPYRKLPKVIEGDKSYPDVVIYLSDLTPKVGNPLPDIGISVILDNPNSKSEADIGSLSSPEINVEVFKYGRGRFVRILGYLNFTFPEYCSTNFDSLKK